MAALALDVFLEGIAAPVGRLTRGDDDDLAFRYLADDLRHPISLSLPLREAPFGDAVTRGFFANLLFENAQREQVMQRHGLAFNDVVGLLFHLGADCPGAISCVPQGAAQPKQPGNLATDYDVLDDATLTEIMVALRDHRRVPDGTRDPSPLAGVQGKIAVTRLADGRLALPRPGLNVPTTHILKVPRRAEMLSVEQEHLLMHLMADIQAHPVAHTEILGQGALRGLLVTRFDRQIAGDNISRIHQEDFCQALGLGPQMKYQRNGNGARAFSAAAIGGLLRQLESPGAARLAFLDISLVNLLLGNTDNHAKNHALIYSGPRPRLAPVYDVVPTLIDPDVTHQLSFYIGQAKMTDDITPTDLADFTRALGFPRVAPALLARMRGIVADVTGRIDGMAGPARKRIGDVMAEQARSLAGALAMDLAIPERDMISVNRP